MSGRRPAARMQLVEVEESILAAARPVASDNRLGGAPPPPSPTPRPSVAGRLRRWWWVAGVAAAAAAAVVLTGQARDRAFVARVADVPGLVRPLDGAPHVRWSAPAAPGADTVVAADGALVVVAESLEGWTLTAYDAGSGDARWSTTIGPVQQAGYESAEARCPSDGADVGPTVLCLVTHPGVVYSRGIDGGDRVRTHVVAVAAADGRELGGWDVRADVLDVGRAGDDLVVSTVADDGHVVVERRDGVSGDVVWRYRSAKVLQSEAVNLVARVHTYDHFVVVEGVATSVLDVDDGHLVLSGASYRALQVAPVGDHFATWAAVGGGRMYDADGERSYVLDGLPVRTSVDDGTASDVVVLDSGQTLSAIDAARGSTRWTAAQALDVRAVVSGRLVVSGSTRYGVVDASDGTERWVRDVGEELPWEPVSDGALVLGPEVDAGGGPQLVGIGLDDGVRYWAVDLPGRVSGLEAVGGRLVARTPGSIVVLG